MNEQEIKAVIEKGGYLYREFDVGVYLFKPERVLNSTIMAGKFWTDDQSVDFKENVSSNTPFKSWREATPEEIKQFLK